jgi:type IV pilus assembly protein PilC
MATVTSKKPEEFTLNWEGKNRAGRLLRGKIKATSNAQANATLRRQGIALTKLEKRRAGFMGISAGKAIKPKDLIVFTKQMAVMLKAGVPLLQGLEIVVRGNSNVNVSRLVGDIKTDIETGTLLSAAFRKYPLYFDSFYCSLIEAGESAGILDQMLERLALYMATTEAIKSKIKSALTYPVSVLTVAFVVIAVIMIFVVPAFKTVFSSFGADLPAPTLLVIAISEFFVAYWWLLIGGMGGGLFYLSYQLKRSVKLQNTMDTMLLRLPLFGAIVAKSCVARWTRTLSTMFAAGVPLVEALQCVGGAAGNSVFAQATTRIQQDVSMGMALTDAMKNTKLFPPMVLQMCLVGEESGSIDHMLGKAADFYELEVDDMVAGISTLVEPLFMVVLGTLIGGIVVAMYMPIFKIGQVV